MPTEYCKQRIADIPARLHMFRDQVVPVESGSGKLKDATNEALRDCVTNPDDTYYLPASTATPHPFPTIVRGFNSIVGQEARSQVRHSRKPLMKTFSPAGKLPE